MATVMDRQPVKLTATTVLLQELTQGQTLRLGKDKTLSLGEISHCFMFNSIKEKDSHHNIDFVTKRVGLFVFVFL